MDFPEPSDRILAVACLVELVAWYGEEGEADYCARLVHATRVLKRIAPEHLRAELEAVRARTGGRLLRPLRVVYPRGEARDMRAD